MFKKQITRIFSLFLLAAVLLCQIAPLSASAAAKKSKTITLSGSGVSKTSIALSWTTSYDYDCFLIYRAQSGGSYKRIAKVTEQSYTDEKLTTGNTYSYKVVGVDGKVKTTSNIKKLNPMQRVSPYIYFGDRDRVILEWSYDEQELSAVSGFVVYRKSSKESAYTRLGTLSGKAYLCAVDGAYIYSYCDTTAKTVGLTYSYIVKPYKGSKTGSGVTQTIVMHPYLILTTGKKTVQVDWTAYPKATAYKVYANIYKYTEDGYLQYVKTKCYGTFKKSAERSYTIKSSGTDKLLYEVYVEAYGTEKGKLKKLCTYESVSSESFYSLMRNAAGRSADTYKVVNVQGEEPVDAWTETVSAADLKIMKNFEKLHFQSGMSDTEKALYVFQWIHYNPVYDYGYATSAAYSYVECIFKKQTGQCLQYNAALVEYLRYLGFDARVLQGYRGQSSNHFWGEIRINGRWYCMETGNYKKDGSWSFFCERYGGWGATRYNICGEIS